MDLAAIRVALGVPGLKSWEHVRAEILRLRTAEEMAAALIQAADLPEDLDSPEGLARAMCEHHDDLTELTRTASVRGFLEDVYAKLKRIRDARECAV